MELSYLEVVKLSELLSTIPTIDPCLSVLLERLLTSVRRTEDTPLVGIPGVSQPQAPALTSQSGIGKRLFICCI